MNIPTDQIVQLQITSSDKYSKYMCQNCLDLLNGCILFRDMCQKTDKAFNEASKVITKIGKLTEVNMSH